MYYCVSCLIFSGLWLVNITHISIVNGYVIQGFIHEHYLLLMVNIPKRYSVQTAEIMLKPYPLGKCFMSFPVFENDTYAVVSGVDLPL
jgi:hypothetical protein